MLCPIKNSEGLIEKISHRVGARSIWQNSLSLVSFALSSGLLLTKIKGIFPSCEKGLSLISSVWPNPGRA
jgi:hypothetical protein